MFDFHNIDCMSKIINTHFDFLLKVDFDAIDNETNLKVNDVIEELLEYLLPKCSLSHPSINILNLSKVSQLILAQLSQSVDILSESEKKLASKLFDLLFAFKLIYSSVSLYKDLDQGQVDFFFHKYKQLLAIKGDKEELNKTRISFVINFLKKVNETQNEDWTLFSFNALVFEYLFWEIKANGLNVYIFEIFPSTMQMANNLLPSNQLIGQQCLNAFLTDPTCFKILEANKYDELIYLKLFNLLYEYEESTFRDIIKNLAILIKKSSVTKACGNEDDPTDLIANDNRKISEVLNLLLDTLITKGNKITLVELYLESLSEQIIPLAKCYLIKNSKKFFVTLNCLLEQIAHMSSWMSTLTAILRTLKNFLIEIDYTINKQSTMIILFNLTRILIKSRFDLKETECRQVYLEILELFVLLEDNANVSCKKNLQEFCTHLKNREELWTKISLFDEDMDTFFKRNILETIDVTV